MLKNITIVKKAKLMAKYVKESKAILQKEMAGKSNDEILEIYNDEEKLKTLAFKIHSQFSEELRTFVTLEKFTATLLSQRKIQLKKMKK